MAVDPRSLSARWLRYRLSLVLAEAGRPMRLAELVAEIERTGKMPSGRASKLVSDALRWEIRRGRVLRLRRGIYCAGSIPRSTRWWMREQVRLSDLTGNLTEPVQRLSDNS